ncbi:MAG: beta-xylosidase, partial [Acidobacteria bacterium]|nr:beta-xylosidase [Acidobacteriota bacterium]
AVMLWNYHDEEKSAPSSPVIVKVIGLPKSAPRLLMTHYRIDDTHSNAYAVWKAMGSPQKPSTQQLAELKAKDGLGLLESPRWMTAEGGTVTIATDMPRHAVSLIHLSW